jgi:hypothetical protein
LSFSVSVSASQQSGAVHAFPIAHPLLLRKEIKIALSTTATVVATIILDLFVPLVFWRTVVVRALKVVMMCLTSFNAGLHASPTSTTTLLRLTLVSAFLFSFRAMLQVESACMRKFFQKFFDNVFLAGISVKVCDALYDRVLTSCRNVKHCPPDSSGKEQNCFENDKLCKLRFDNDTQILQTVFLGFNVVKSGSSGCFAAGATVIPSFAFLAFVLVALFSYFATFTF